MYGINYLIMLTVQGYQNTSSTNANLYVHTDIITTNLGITADNDIGNTNIRNTFTLPVKNTLTQTISGIDFTSCGVYLHGYRRLGNNP